MTNLEAKQKLAKKLDIDYDNIANNGLVSDADLQDAIQTGVQVAWDMHAWDFKEGAKTGTLSSGNVSAGYVDYPQDMVTGGATYLVVNSEEFPPEYKISYRDYLKWKQDNPNATDKYWSEYKRFLFFNMNAAAAGQTFDVYGMLRCITLSNDSDLLPFSPDADDQEDSGNNAIVDLAYAELLEGEKYKNEEKANTVRNKATARLEKVWEPMKQYKATQQPKNRPFFAEVPDFFGSGTDPKYIIGNF